MKSPKGNYRLKEIGLLGILFLLLVALSGGYDNYGVWHLEKFLSPNGWIFKQMNNISEICIGLMFLYMGSRIVNHDRTHELLDLANKQQRIIVFGVWVGSIAYVIGNALH